MRTCIKVFKNLKIKEDFIFDNEKSLSLNSRKCRSELRKYLVSLGYSLDQMEIITTSEGKPYFKSLELNFSFSHSKHFSTFAVSSNKVGVDIETIDPTKNYAKLAKRLSISDPDFLQEWTRREAILKLSGGSFPELFYPPKRSFNTFFTKTNNLYIHLAEEI